MFVTSKSVVLSVALISLAIGVKTANAQRYLSEFVGSTRVVSGLAANFSLDTNLEFVEQQNRRVDGSFFIMPYIENDPLRQPQVLSANGTLAASGNCNVKIEASSTSGSLRLVEETFDVNSFALFGSVTINESSNAGALPRGKSVGNVALLRPVADALIISPRDRILSFHSDLTGKVSESVLTIDSMNNGLVRGLLGLVAADAWDVTASASERWFYLVGETRPVLSSCVGALSWMSLAWSPDSPVITNSWEPTGNLPTEAR